jgi:hypothetical protein
MKEFSRDSGLKVDKEDFERSQRKQAWQFKTDGQRQPHVEETAGSPRNIQEL